MQKQTPEQPTLTSIRTKAAKGLLTLALGGAFYTADKSFVHYGFDPSKSHPPTYMDVHSGQNPADVLPDK